MIIFNIILLLVVFGTGYILFNAFTSPIRYNSWVEIRTGFFSGFVGRVNAGKFFKYRVRFVGREVNNVLTDRIDREGWAWWWNLEVREVPTDFVKEDFCNKIQPNTQSWNLVSTVPYGISTATSAISSSYSDLVSVEGEDNV